MELNDTDARLVDAIRKLGELVTGLLGKYTNQISEEVWSITFDVVWAHNQKRPFGSGFGPKRGESTSERIDRLITVATRAPNNAEPATADSIHKPPKSIMRRGTMSGDSDQGLDSGSSPVVAVATRRTSSVKKVAFQNANSKVLDSEESGDDEDEGAFGTPSSTLRAVQNTPSRSARRAGSGSRGRATMGKRM